ncbi:hypothetical protein PR048_015969 [Dryococelus australis]|uniref:Uncharacterized protein n=1 Tax=Dryococelus australis TaxID=614101 RepID=A0ABQ9HIF6_9NEOP|nr:hypothetical protein PR048_015969 [Dryococelus australis]
MSAQRRNYVAVCLRGRNRSLTGSAANRATRYCVLPYWLRCRPASRLRGADWRTQPGHIAGEWSPWWVFHLRTHLYCYGEAAVVRLLASHLGEPGSFPDFRTWESCQTRPLLAGILKALLFSPVLSFRRCSILTSRLPHRLSTPHYRDRRTDGPLTYATDFVTGAVQRLVRELRREGLVIMFVTLPRSHRPHAPMSDVVWVKESANDTFIGLHRKLRSVQRAAAQLRENRGSYMGRDYSLCWYRLFTVWEPPVTSTLDSQSAPTLERGPWSLRVRRWTVALSGIFGETRVDGVSFLYIVHGVPSVVA